MDRMDESELKINLGKQVVEDREDDDIWADSLGLVEGHAICVICLEKILIQETAIVKGCEHAYCLICILRWATYKENPSCPQCKHPFEFLSIHRSLDGRIHDYMFEESVCLLLRAIWFTPLATEAQTNSYEEEDLSNFYYEEHNENDEEEENEAFFARGLSSIRIGNRRWGDNGFVRDGRKEARPVNRRLSEENEAGPSRRPKMEAEGSSMPPTGRRAKRTLKREAANKAAFTKQ